MIDLIDGTALGSQLRQLCESAKRVRMAVAFWGEGAYEILSLQKSSSEVRIVCNLRSGGTNPRVILAMTRAGFHVKQLDDLHAKIYLFDDVGFIGSSNMSANGLSMQGREAAGWTESNIMFDASNAVFAQAERQFESIWQRSRSICENDLQIAEQRWSLRREAGIPTRLPSKMHLLEALSETPDIFTDMRIYLRVDVEEMSREAISALHSERTRLSSEDELDCWESWDEMPERATIISFLRGPRGGLRFDGFWYAPKHRREKRTASGSTIQLVDHLEDVQGIKTIGPLADWTKIVDGLFAPVDRDGGGITVELGTLARELSSLNRSS